MRVKGVFTIVILAFLVTGCVDAPSDKGAEDKSVMCRMPQDEYEDAILQFSKDFYISLACANDTRYVRDLYDYLKVNAKSNAHLGKHIKEHNTQVGIIANDLHVGRPDDRTIYQTRYAIMYALQEYMHPDLNLRRNKKNIIRRLRNQIMKLEKSRLRTYNSYKKLYEKYGYDPNCDVFRVYTEHGNMIVDIMNYAVDYIETNDSVDAKFCKNFLRMMGDSVQYQSILTDAYLNLISNTGIVWLKQRLHDYKLPPLPSEPVTAVDDPKNYIHVSLYWAMTFHKMLRTLNLIIDDTNKNKVGRILLKQFRNNAIKTGEIFYFDCSNMLGRSASYRAMLNVDIDGYTSENVLINTGEKRNSSNPEHCKLLPACVFFHELKHCMNYVNKSSQFSNYLARRYLFDPDDPVSNDMVFNNDEELRTILGIYDPGIECFSLDEVLSKIKSPKFKFSYEYKRKKLSSLKACYNEISKTRDVMEDLFILRKPARLNPQVDMINEFVFNAIRHEGLGGFNARYQHARLNHNDIAVFHRIIRIISKHYGLNASNDGGSLYISAPSDFYSKLHKKLDAVEKRVDDEFKSITMRAK